MRYYRIGVCLFAFLILMTGKGIAELQNVEVGGDVKIRASYYSGSVGLTNPVKAWPRVQYRWRDVYLSGRPTGVGGRGFGFGGPGAGTIVSSYLWNDEGVALKSVTQRTRLHVNASFTDDVSAYIDLESTDTWGEDFRSNYLTGQDLRAATTNDVEFFQSYIQTNNTFGVPLRLRLGRQEMVLGDGWLVGANNSGQKFYGVSFDGVRATYSPKETLTLDAFWLKLAELSPMEEDSDTDFYGLYASYTGIANTTLDAYWLYLRDAQSYEDTSGVGSNWIERIVGRDDYDAVAMHTVGMRAKTTLGGFVLQAEGAYQFGDAGRIGGAFRPYNFVNNYFPNATLLGRNRYGDDDASFGNWAADALVGYAFDNMRWSPFPFLHFAYLGGEDNRELSFNDWAASHLNPFFKPQSSISFNRLFSDYQYSDFLELDHSLSSAWILGAGVRVQPTDKIGAQVTVTHLAALAAFDAPRTLFGGYADRFVLAIPPFSFITKETSKDLGWELTMRVKYAYSDDLSFIVSWSHLFVGEGLAKGSFSDANGIFFNGGTGKDDADYLYTQTQITF